MGWTSNETSKLGIHLCCLAWALCLLFCLSVCLSVSVAASLNSAQLSSAQLTDSVCLCVNLCSLWVRMRRIERLKEEEEEEEKEWRRAGFPSITR